MVSDNTQMREAVYQKSSKMIPEFVVRYLGAAAVGLRAIWLTDVRPWPPDRPESPWQIATLGELVELVHSEP